MVIDRTVDTYGQLNVPVNNAGIESISTAEETTDEESDAYPPCRSMYANSPPPALTERARCSPPSCYRRELLPSHRRSRHW